MIEKAHIIKMAEHILRRQRGVADREAVNPAREWLIGVGVTTLIVLCGGILSYSLYRNTISLEVNTEHIPSVVIPYNAAVVDDVVEKFRVRADAYTGIRGVIGAESVNPIVPATPVEATSTEQVPAEVIPDEPLPVEEIIEIPEDGGRPPELGV